MEEVLTHQSSLDRVNERAQALLQTNADAKTSHAITQLTTRYHSVISMSKVCFTFKSFKYQVLILFCRGLLMTSSSSTIRLLLHIYIKLKKKADRKLAISVVNSKLFLKASFLCGLC